MSLPHLVTISGSLRPGSVNSLLLEKAEALAINSGLFSTVDRTHFAEIPFFAAQLEHSVPPAVSAARQLIASADCLLLATPEYNGSPPAMLKNGIDWLSRPRGSAVLAGLPVATLSASPGQRGGLGAQEHLRRVLSIAGAAVVDQPPVVWGGADATQGPDPVVLEAVDSLLRALAARADLGAQV